MTRTRQFRYGVSFAIIAATFALLTIGGTLPTPLYTLWGDQFAFGAQTTTWIFASYVLGTLVALVLAGGLSDQIGRRPLAIAALVLAGVSTAFFIFAGNVPMLLAGRFISGIAVGLITSAATAALAEFYRGENKAFPSMISTAANMGGLGLGPLIAGVFAQQLPAPTQLVFVMYIIMIALVLVLTFFVPETHPRIPGTRINWVPRVGVPREAVSVYWRSAIAVFPTFTLLALFSSLTPRFLGGTLHIENHIVAGLATFVLFEIGVAAQLVFRSRLPRWSILRGLPLLIIALALVLAGFLSANLALFIAGTIVGGLGSGLTFIGSLGQLSRAVPHDSHAKSVAAYFIAAQLGLALPILSIGILSDVIGLNQSTSAVVGAVMILAAVAWLINFRAGRMKTSPIVVNRPITVPPSAR
jgi:MFS family permease